MDDARNKCENCSKSECQDGCKNAGWCYHCTTSLGVCLIIVGALFFLNDLGYLPFGVSVWTIGFLALGLYLLGSRRRL